MIVSFLFFSWITLPTFHFNFFLIFGCFDSLYLFFSIRQLSLLFVRYPLVVFLFMPVNFFSCCLTQFIRVNPHMQHVFVEPLSFGLLAMEVYSIFKFFLFLFHSIFSFIILSFFVSIILNLFRSSKFYQRQFTVLLELLYFY